MRRITLYMVSTLLFALIMVSCGGEAVPIIQMTEAKAAISKAEKYGAPQYAADKYGEAVDLLKESHDWVKEGDLDRAQRRAERAKARAEEAMVEAAPRMVEGTLASARENIQKAIVANAEVFAPQELQNAQMELRNAELKMEQRQYDPAISSALTADGKAQEAYTISMGKKQLIRDAIMEVRQTLVAAQEYGAQEVQPDTFESARDDLSTAVDTYRTDQLKDSYTAVRSAKEKADQLYAVVIEEASQENLAQAQAQLSRAAASPGAASAQDELNASEEMLETARSQHNDSQYRESLDSSNESMRLSAIVLGTEGQVAVVEPEPVEGALTETDEYWVYEVQARRGRPKDCLRLIAKRFYNDELKWNYIYDANRDMIRNPNLIYPGWDLKVPKWDQPGGPVSSSTSVETPEPAEPEIEDAPAEETPVMEEASAAVSEETMADDTEDAAVVEGSAPESSSDDTVEVVPAD